MGTVKDAQFYSNLEKEGINMANLSRETRDVLDTALKALSYT
jgi:lambda repressor-like predicted transcriptional regulator